jgi:hypothetical protein
MRRVEELNIIMEREGSLNKVVNVDGIHKF